MKKKTALLLAITTIIMSFSGCDTKNVGSVSESTSESASESTSASVSEAYEQTPSDGSEVEFDIWKDIDKNKVIASVEGHDEFNITFGDFYREYRYYLISNGISDDFADEQKSVCEELRSSIITYLEFEKIFLSIAEELGVGVSSLTDGENLTIAENAETTIKNMCSQYNSKASEQLGADATQAELEALELELLESALSKCGLSTEIFYTWERSDFVQNKLLEKITENINITEEQVDEMFKEYVELAEAAYAESPVSYESNSAYTSVYIPDGTRLASQILLLFDEDVRSSINQARALGNTEEADRLRREAYENNSEIKQKAADIEKLIKSGNSFEELQETYNEDTVNTPYTVVPGSQYFVSEFVDGVFGIDEIGGVSDVIVSDFGIHFIKYAGDAELSDDDISAVRSSMRSFLHDMESDNIKSAEYDEWFKRYPYTTDYETLRLADPDREEAEQTETE